MHVVYLNLLSDETSQNPDIFFNSSPIPHTLYNELTKGIPEVVTVVQRAIFNATIILENVSYHFVKDEFEPSLRWWQEPVTVLERLSEVQSDIIQVRGLDLPLQFRWMRRVVGDKIKIIGEHTGETIWANRNLWLQQFGLRVVDGFVFNRLKDAREWIKASVILENQPISEIPFHSKDPRIAAKLLLNFYDELITTK
jgi:hypothetical protein